ncbi:MAG: hypothetical protein K6A28_04120, partial [Bacteroidales bacterium]|nr:hypothetical protein [Bacteroidales bacterium]
GDLLFEQKVPVEMVENQNRSFYVEGLGECLATHKKDEVYVKLELTEAESLLAERFCYLAYPKDLKLPEPELSLGIVPKGDKIFIDVTSDVFAKDVQLTASPGEGSFSDNYFDLEPGVTKRVVFTARDPKGAFTFSSRSL